MDNLKSFSIFLNESKYDGEIVYHGTSKSFTSFKLSKGISNRTYGKGPTDNGLGIFFTDNKTMAGFFAGTLRFKDDGYVNTGKKGKIISAKLDIKKPYVIDETHPEYNEDYDSVQIYFKEIDAAGGAEKYRNKLETEGYDGIILRGCTTNYYEDGTYSVYVVFNPVQIHTVLTESRDFSKNKKEITASELTFILKTIGKKPEFIKYANKHSSLDYIIDDPTPYNLTHGLCNPLAYYLMDRYYGLSIFSLRNKKDGNHLVLKFKDKYYDAVNVNGVNRPEDFDFFKSKKDIIVKLLE